jgi:hypothetical protein
MTNTQPVPAEVSTFRVELHQALQPLLIRDYERRDRALRHALAEVRQQMADEGKYNAFVVADALAGVCEREIDDRKRILLERLEDLLSTWSVLAWDTVEPDVVAEARAQLMSQCRAVITIFKARLGITDAADSAALAAPLERASKAIVGACESQTRLVIAGIRRRVPTVPFLPPVVPPPPTAQTTPATPVDEVVGGTFGPALEIAMKRLPRSKLFALSALITIAATVGVLGGVLPNIHDRFSAGIALALPIVLTITTVVLTRDLPNWLSISLVVALAAVVIVVMIRSLDASHQASQPPGPVLSTSPPVDSTPAHKTADPAPIHRRAPTVRPSLDALRRAALAQVLMTEAGADDTAGVRSTLAQLRDPNVRDKTGRTPLHAAAEQCHVDVMARLLADHADVTAHDNDGRTPFLTSSEGGCLAGDILLAANNADLLVTDRQGRNSLMAAARVGSVPVARYLLDHGFRGHVDDVDTAPTPYRTALGWSRYFDSPETRAVERLLLDAGADPTSTTVRRSP